MTAKSSCTTCHGVLHHAEMDVGRTPTPGPSIAHQGARRPAGTRGLFNSPIPIPSLPFAGQPTALYDGHLQLSAAAAAKCAASATGLSKLRKLVYAYQEKGPGGQTTFSMCPSGDYAISMWLLVCRNKLSDPAGGDLAGADCICKVPDDTRPCCPLSRLGLQQSVTTRTGSW